jgi:hypothetical protein
VEDKIRGISAEDWELVREVEGVMGEDSHGALNLLCIFGAQIRRDGTDVDLIRKQLRAYVARRKMGERITMREIRDVIIEAKVNK